MVLRELLAVFGLSFDDKGAKHAEGAVDHLLEGVEKLKSAVQATLFAEAFGEIVEAAAKAEESANQVEHIFGENADGVKAWAETTATAVGRSAFSLEEFAVSIGKTIAPMVGNTQAAAEMSTNLAALAVDLSSFAGISEEQALDDLRAGLTGRAMGLKRVGVLLDDRTLQAFAVSKGIHQDVSTMNEASLATLRYQFIMAKTHHIQGDAIRDAALYANRIKALKGVWDELVTKAGQTVLPALEKIVGVLTDALHWFEKTAEGTKIFQSALIVLAILAAAALVPLLPLILSVIELAAAAALAAIFLDDFMAFLEGRPSALEDGLNALSQALFGTTDPASALLAVIMTISEAIGWFGNLAAAIFLALTGDLSGFKLLWEDYDKSMQAVGKTLDEVFLGAWITIKDTLAEVWNWLVKIAEKAVPDWLKGGLSSAAGFLGMGGSVGAGSGSASVSAGAGGGTTVVQQTNAFNMELNAGATDDPDALLLRAEDRFRTMLDEQHEAAAAALSQAVPAQ